MKLTFAYTPEDLDEWAKSAAAKSAGQLKGRSSVFGWLLFIALAVMLVMVINRRNDSGGQPNAAAPAAQSSQNVWTDLVLPLVPWVLIFGFIWFFVFRQLRAGKHLWKTNKNLQDPQEMTIEPDFLEIAGPTSSTRYRYTAFDEWTETRGLFLLRLPPQQFLMIPKRALSETQQQELRELFKLRITQAFSAFPVLPVNGK